MPQVVPKAARLSSVSPRAVSHSCAAFFHSVAACWSFTSAACSLALAFVETHLPNALRPNPFVPSRPFVPYCSSKSSRYSVVVPRSVRQSLAALV